MMHLPTKLNFRQFFPLRRVSAHVASLRHELAYRQSLVDERWFAALETKSLPILEYHGWSALQDELAHIKPTRRKGPRKALGVLLQRYFRVRKLFSQDLSKQKKAPFSGRLGVKFRYANMQANFRQTKRKKYRDFTFSAYNKHWQFKWEKRLYTWFYPFATQYYARFKRIAGAATVNNTQTYVKQQQKFIAIGEPAVLFFLRDLWPYSSIQFILNMLKQGICFVNGTPVTDPFLKINYYDILFINLPPLFFLTFLLFFNKISTKGYHTVIRKTNAKKYNLPGNFEMNYKTNEFFLIKRIFPLNFEKKTYKSLRNDEDIMLQQYMYKKQRKFGLNRT